MQKLPNLFLLLGLTSSLSGCWINLENTTVQEATFVVPTGGTLSAGCDVTHLIAATGSFMTEDQCLQFLQLQTHPDPTDPTKTIVDHYAAIAMSLDDFTALKNELEIMCRDLGTHCSYALATAVTNMNKKIEDIKSSLIH